MVSPEFPGQAQVAANDPLSMTRKGQPRERTWLAVECSGSGLLLPLADAGEISQFTGCIDVPHTRSWFLGVANLRGQLQGVVDLAAFLGLSPAGGAPLAVGWMVALNTRLDANCALRVDQLSGLRREDELTAVDADAFSATARPRFAGLRYREEAAPERIWQEIKLAELATDAHFLDILARS